MKTKKIYVDVHVLQTVPPSCVNRDDTGSPKTAVYGGVTRARVSSQSWKHAVRKKFKEMFSEGDIGKRTKKIVALVANEIKALDSSLDSESLAQEALERADLKIKGKEKGTDALFFMSLAQTKALAELIVDDKKYDKRRDKERYEVALKSAPSFDMALFGRMVASNPSLNYDAAAQVAHSISTHGVRNEYDYFTALDDCSSDDNVGAGHLGTIEFNSSTLYRYATVNVLELAKSLGKDTSRVVGGFVEAFVRSMPEGKINTFANDTLPDMVYVTIRRDQPVNLCGAFEKPVISQGGYVEKSAERFEKYAKEVYDNYAAEPEVALGVGKLAEPLAEVMSLDKLLEELREYVQVYLDEGEKK